MDWRVWLSGICFVSGAGLFAYGMRRDPILAAGIPGSLGVLMAVLLFLVFSGRPANDPPIVAGASEENPANDPSKPPDLKPSNGADPLAMLQPGKAAAQNGEQVNLLSWIDPSRHQLSGPWRMENGALITPMIQGTVPAKLTVPVKPPESFQLIAVVERLQGRDSISFGFPVGGQDVMVCIDGFNGIYSGINLIDRSTADRNESRRRGPFLRNGQPNRIVCNVGPDSVHVTVNDRTAVDWTGDVNRLSLDRRWPHGPLGQLEIGSWQTSYRITKLVLRPLP